MSSAGYQFNDDALSPFCTCCLRWQALLEYMYCQKTIDMGFSHAIMFVHSLSAYVGRLLTHSFLHSLICNVYESDYG
jgi:hypothetical protein